MYGKPPKLSFVHGFSKAGFGHASLFLKRPCILKPLQTYVYSINIDLQPKNTYGKYVNRKPMKAHNSSYNADERLCTLYKCLHINL